MQKCSFVNQVELDICKSLLGIDNPSSTVERNGVLSWKTKGDANFLTVPLDYTSDCFELMLEPMANAFIFKLKPLGDFLDKVPEHKNIKLTYPKIAVIVVADSNDLVANNSEIRQKLMGEIL